jgi:hypothetical protein
MPGRIIGLLVAITIGLLASSASAQDDPRVGITMGFPASIGVIWHVSERIALRPEITATRASGESTTTSSISVIGLGGVVPTTTTTTVTTIESWQVSTGLSALFYVSKHDALRTYVSPRWAYSRTSSSSNSGIADLGSFGSTGSSHTVTGSFGAQYALGRRFNVFGEVGLSFSRSTTTPRDLTTGLGFVTTTSGAVSRNFGTRSGVGVILYF